MKIIEEILKIIDITVILYLMYYLITGIFVFIKPRRKINYRKKIGKFAIIIPARNEEKVIGNLINSLKEQNYEKNMYTIFAVPNNCTDKTEEVARQNGAEIIPINKRISSKGEALRCAFEYIMENCNPYDAYIIFDADNVVHPNFLLEMNEALCQGYKIAQGYRDSKNPSDTWISSCYSLHYLIQNYFVNESRMNISQACFINGTGFMIASELLNDIPYKTNTMTEDIEFTIQNLIADEKIAFVKKAITYDEQVVSFGESYKQRKRWSVGTMQCLEQYGVRLIKRLVKDQNIKALDGLIFLLAPTMQIVGFISGIMHTILKLALEGNIDYQALLVSAVFSYILSILTSVIALRSHNKEIKKYIKGILTLPIFMLSWIPINFYATFKRNITWEPIRHTRIISYNNLIE